MKHQLLIGSRRLFRYRILDGQQVLCAGVRPIEPDYVGGDAGAEAGEHIDPFPITEIERFIVQVDAHRPRLLAEEIRDVLEFSELLQDVRMGCRAFPEDRRCIVPEFEKYQCKYCDSKASGRERPRLTGGNNAGQAQRAQRSDIKVLARTGLAELRRYQSSDQDDATEGDEYPAYDNHGLRRDSARQRVQADRRQDGDSKVEDREDAQRDARLPEDRQDAIGDSVKEIDAPKREEQTGQPDARHQGHGLAAPCRANGDRGQRKDADLPRTLPNYRRSRARSWR